MLDILFIGGVYLEQRKNEILQNAKSALQLAADNLQWNYLRGFKSHTDCITLVNSMFVGTFPRHYKMLFIRSKCFPEGVTGRLALDAGFMNAPLFVGKSKYRHMKKEIAQWCGQNNGKPKLAVAYSLCEEMLRSLAYIKTLDKDIKTCLIILDLPEFMSHGTDAGMSGYHRYVANKINVLFSKNIGLIDGFAVITRQIAERYALKNYVVIEGIAEPGVYDRPVQDGRSFTFLYAGSLNYGYGIEELLAAFAKIEDGNARLLICGDGPCKKNVNEAAKNDARIEHLGIVETKECLRLQQKASCLVNPRPYGKFTMYSFPSKVLEYMGTGTPVISRMLEGIPAEYMQYIITAEADEGALYEAMERAMNMDPQTLREIGLNAHTFVKTQKKATVQTSKIVTNLINPDMVKGCQRPPEQI